MKRQVLTLAMLLLVMLPAIFSQQSYHEVYGQLPNDLNRSNAILQMDANTYVLGGEWNGIGFMLKVDHTGQLIDYFFLDNTIPGNSTILDMEFDPAGNIIATGECDHCAQTDTLKRVFSVATEPSLLLINSEIYEGIDPSNPLLFSPALVAEGNQLLFAATTGGQGLNFQDMALFSITANLNTVWSKSFNSCSNCGFEKVVDMAATSQGYAILVNNALTDSLSLYHLDMDGELIWKKRHAVLDGSEYKGLAYRNGVLYASGTEDLGNDKGGFIRRFSENDGSVVGSMSLDFAGVDDDVLGMQFTDDGTLLAIHQRAQPNNFGSYQVSRIYRVNTATNQVIDFSEIPNPDVLTGIVTADVQPVTSDGVEFTACGRQGLFDNLSFFYSKNSEEPQPPGVIFNVTPDTACAPATIVLSNSLAGASSYSWKLDGVEFSTAQNPDPIVIDEGGTHDIKLEATTTSQNTITNFVVQSLPEIWNECAICDNKPDPYIIIKNQVGTTLYTSGWVENYPPVSLSVSFSMSTTATYKIEVWDKDNIGADDYFGVITIPGSTTGGTFSYVNSEDPSNPLIISFNTIPNLATETHTQSVLVYKPSISLMPGDVLQADAGNPAPAFYTWQWYHNGVPIPGAVNDTYQPTVGGEYVVAMVTPECAALSNDITVSAQFIGVDLMVTEPLCHGDSTGAILVNTIGGTPPFSYQWNAPGITGENPDGLPAGTYAVIVSDANGQEQIAQTTMNQPPVLTVDLETTHLSCAGDSSGAILVDAIGGTGAYSFEWSVAGVAGSNPAGLSAGEYTVVVTDENGCSHVGSAMIEEPSSITATTSSTPEGNSQSDGTASVLPDGGTPPYSFEWNTSPTQTTQTATDLPTGQYAVIVTDANGCTFEASVFVEMILGSTEEQAAEWLVYPNPTAGVVFIENEGFNSGKIDIEIHDLAGKLLLENKSSGMPAATDLSAFPDGTYLISIIFDNKRIVKKVSLIK